MDEETLSRLLTFKNDVVLAIRLSTGQKMILGNNIVLSGKLSGKIASFILENSKKIEKPEVIDFNGEMIYFEPINIKKYLDSIGKELSDELITLKNFETMNIDEIQVVDARSPKEYFEKTVPGAVNIPLFLTEEHEKIGKTYKNEGKEIAMNMAAQIIQEGIKRIVFESLKLDSNKEIIVFCARGGMRSQSVSTILKLLGFKVKRLIGGFKSYNLSKKHEQNHN
ncbi:Rhodanese domain protein [Methanococcus vannielii SB]|jgi:tRNA 2-selenouridine synthase|uniref:Rhodanese domain protein n=1 Tax=Methanococcus vannielii (strain ATCC 35089 / DSM 1224 / JCM 13029 / OCM 148 / SB) TaxID=406327 RepID=A6UN64_METVS|nr:selenouridine synthase SelU-like subunit [Methanococcus vannielii]ABR53936.1 Rhodanese domain protein [Methanococcus vannielii SB]